MKISPALLALAAGGAVLYLLSSKSNAATRAPSIFGATPATSAALTGGYAVTPAGGARYVQAAPSPLTALIQAGASLFGGASRGASAATLPGQILRDPGYVPVATFDSAGEQAAASYYASHADEFIAVTPDYSAINATPWAIAALNDPSEY